MLTIDYLSLMTSINTSSKYTFGPHFLLAQRNMTPGLIKNYFEKIKHEINKKKLNGNV